ncbi:MAG TPA: ester cyclase [Kofleriaceae bacterium]|nr:ester cyclase [Kofleriaceae bacterium]
MKIRTTVVLAIALTTTATACKKKKTEGTQEPQGTTPKTTEPGPGSNPTPEPPKPTPKTGQELAAAYTACVNQINDAKFDDFRKNCIADSYTAHQMDGDDISGGDKMVEYFKNMRVGFPDLKLSPQLVMVNGRNILAVELMTGTNSADSKTPDGKDMKATNKKVGALMLHKLAINDENKATEEWVYMDQRTILGQLGVLPKEAGKTRPALEKGWDGAPIVLVTADDAKEKANLEAVKKANDAINAHKVADVSALVTDDVIESDQAGDADHKGKKEMEKSTQGFLAAFPDVKIDAPNVYAAGDYVIVLGTMTGTNKGPMGPIKATNKQVTGNYAEVVKLKDGKIAELWRFRNSMAMAKQLGLMPDAAKPGDATKTDATKTDATKTDAKDVKKDADKKTPDATKKDATK